MQDRAIVLGGLENGYMKKLALYLKTRMDSRIEVGVVENGKEPAPRENVTGTVWMGSEDFVNKMAGSDQAANRIILDDEETEEEAHIFRFRSCDRIYRDIRKKCQVFGFYPQAGVRMRKQKWYAVTTDGAAGDLLAFSLTLARILSDREQVLYVNLTECSGMRRLFDLDPDPDLSDLILELRKNEAASPETFTGRLGPLDCLLPPENPMILHEIGGEDMERFLRAVGRSGRYGCVVFAVGTAVCGSEQIFSSGSRIIHLTEQGLLRECARDERITFIRRCAGEEASVKQIRLPGIRAENRGEQLLEDWMEEPVGRLARSCLREVEEEAGSGAQSIRNGEFGASSGRVSDYLQDEEGPYDGTMAGD